MAGLPVITVVSDAMGEVHSKWRVLLKALILPAVVISFIESILANLPETMFWSFATWALTAPLYVLFAVVCHRVVILGESSLPRNNGLFWSERETKFLGWTIALIILTWGLGLLSGIFVLFLPKSILGMSTPWLPMFIVATILSYFYIRLSLVFPASATDQNTSLADAMLLSSGNGLRMMAAIFIPVLPLMAVVFIGWKILGDQNAIAEYIFGEVMAYAVMIVAICVVSVIYRTLVDFELIDEM